MVVVVNNIIFLFGNLLFLDSKILALSLDYAYAPDQIDEAYKMPGDIPRRTRHERGTDNHECKYGKGYTIAEMVFVDDADLDLSVEKQRQCLYGDQEKRLRGDQERRQSYARFFSRRNNRATQAGYTNNVDTCKLYNTNLEKVWMALAGFIGPNEKTPDNMALHNIVLLVKAYLDHHSLLVKNDEKFQRENDNKQAIIPELVTEIKEILEGKPSKKNEDTASKIVALIVSLVKTPKDKIDKKCFQLRIEKLKFNVNREYQRYNELSVCRRQNLTGKKALTDFEKMSPSDAMNFLRQWEEDPGVNCAVAARNTFLKSLKAVINKYVSDMQCIE